MYLWPVCACVPYGLCKGLFRRRSFIEKPTASLNICGLRIFQIGHEDATGQFEVNHHYVDVLTAALGQQFITEFIRLKRAEWTEYSQQVSAWELSNYLERF